MNICESCGKDFKYSSKLLRHLNKKYPCISNTFLLQNVKNSKKVNNFSKKVNENETFFETRQKKVTLEVKSFSCNKCSKVLKSNYSLKKHSEICKGVTSLQCPTCLKVFSNKVSKCRHIKNGKCNCVPQEEIDLSEEIKALKKQVSILESTKASITNNNITNNNTNITNYTIKYQVRYNPETKCLTTDDPKAPFPELLCFNGFKHEAAKSKLKNIDQDALQEHIDNVRNRKDYYNLYTFFFRNVDNSRLHMFTMGKNNNTTHAQVFNNGSLEKMEKSQLFDNVSKYIGQYLLNMSIDNIDVINMVLSDQASKNAFLEVTKDNSQVFNYFKTNEGFKDMLAI